MTTVTETIVIDTANMPKPKFEIGELVYFVTWRPTFHPCILCCAAKVKSSRNTTCSLLHNNENRTDSNIVVMVIICLEMKPNT